MPKIRPLSAQEIISALERAGFEILRQRGSHITVGNRESRRSAVIAVHSGRDIPTGTLRNILTQAGLTPEEFLRLLK